MARKPKKKQKKKPTSRQTSARGRQAAEISKLGHKPDVRIDKAQQAWQERHYDEAIWFYERALQRDPTNAVLLVDVARAYGLRFRYAEAEKLIARACAIHPDDPRLATMLGRSYLHLQQFDDAIECFRRALELAPESSQRAESLYELAKMYERLHRLEEARKCAEESLSLAPEQPVLRYLMAMIDRREGNPDKALAPLDQLVTAEDVTPGIRADAHYQLALIHDKAGRYSEAYQALIQAKHALANSSTPYRNDAHEIKRIGNRTTRTLTAEQCLRWCKSPNQFKRLGGGLALLTSHPRSGTTLLEQVLDAHAELISADELQVMTEMVYIPLCCGSSTDTPVPEILDATPADELERRRQAYFTAMEGALRESIGERMLLDKNPALTGLLPVIARVFPEMKIVFALRDPRDVVLSCFMQQLPLNPVSVYYLTLEETAREYASTMRAWLKFREIIQNPWLEVRYEETVTDLESQARRVLEFLGLRWDATVLDYREKVQRKHVHSPTYEAVTKPVYTSSIGRWKNYEQQLEPCLDTLRPFVEAFGYDV